MTHHSILLDRLLYSSNSLRHSEQTESIWVTCHKARKIGDSFKTRWEAVPFQPHLEA